MVHCCSDTRCNSGECYNLLSKYNYSILALVFSREKVVPQFQNRETITFILCSKESPEEPIIIQQERRNSSCSLGEDDQEGGEGMNSHHCRSLPRSRPVQSWACAKPPIPCVFMVSVKDITSFTRKEEHNKKAGAKRLVIIIPTKCKISINLSVLLAVNM